MRFAITGNLANPNADCNLNPSCAVVRQSKQGWLAEPYAGSCRSGRLGEATPPFPAPPSLAHCPTRRQGAQLDFWTIPRNAALPANLFPLSLAREGLEFGHFGRANLPETAWSVSESFLRWPPTHRSAGVSPASSGGVPPPHPGGQRTATVLKLATGTVALPFSKHALSVRVRASQKANFPISFPFARLSRRQTVHAALFRWQKERNKPTVRADPCDNPKRCHPSRIPRRRANVVYDIAMTPAGILFVLQHGGDLVES
jgi:hypothetical protein